MLTVTNKHNLPLPIQFWLESDDYDYDSRKKAFSASTMVKSSKKAKLSKQVLVDPNINATFDIIESVGNRRGSAIHTAIEVATDAKRAEGWNVMQELRLEYPLVVDGVEYIITGKFDVLVDGVVTDWKTESTYSFNDAVKRLERIQQLSVYTWLCHRLGYPCSRTVADFVHIFTDWKPAIAKAQAESGKYPLQAVVSVRVPVMSKLETEAWMSDRIRSHISKEDPNSVMCTREDLWMGEPIWQYLTKASNTRASKNFTGKAAYFEALNHKNTKGVGVIREKPQKATACKYCLGRFNCDQYKILDNQGLIDNED